MVVGTFQPKAPIFLSGVWVTYWAFTRVLIITLLMCSIAAFKAFENYLGVADLSCFQSSYSKCQERTWAYVNYAFGLLCKSPWNNFLRLCFSYLFKYIFTIKTALYLLLCMRDFPIFQNDIQLSLIKIYLLLNLLVKYFPDPTVLSLMLHKV